MACSERWEIIIPEERTNLILNPSIDIDTTGYSASGTNTIARDGNHQKFGPYSLKCTYSNNTTLATYAGITLTAAAHAFSAWVYLDSNWDGGAVRLALANFTSVVIDTATTQTTTLGKWQRLEILFTPDASDLIGDLIVECASAPTAGRIIWADGFQCELGAYSTTFLYGNLSGDYKWNGAEHGSTSTRGALEPSGGRVRNISSDLGLKLESHWGTGMMDVVNLASEQSAQSGRLFEGQILRERRFTLRGSIVESTDATYHSTKQGLIRALNPNTTKIDQRGAPRVLRYTGAVVDKEIQAVYNNGLKAGFREEKAALNLSIQMLADDPLFYQIGETAQELNTQDTSVFYNVVARINGQWGNLGATAVGGTTPAAYCVAVGPDKKVYWGGSFTSFDGNTNANRIVGYDGNSFFNLGPGLGATNGDVHDICFGVDGTLYAVGVFTNMAGTAANRVAAWNGSSWAALGTGADGNVYACLIDNDGNLVIGGAFTTVGGVTCRGVAKWDGSSWSAVGPPTSGGTVWAMAVGANGNLYIGGSFTNWDGDPTGDYAAYWDGSSWFPMGDGLDNTVNDILPFPDGTLMYGGVFTTAGTVSAKYIAIWNGLAWDVVPGGTLDTGGVVGLGIDDKGVVWITGNFGISGAYLNGIRLWNGSTLYWPEISIAYAQIVHAVTFVNGDVYLGTTIDGLGRTHAGATTIEYVGTSKAYPRFLISRTGGTDATLTGITNVTTGARLSFDYSLLDGEQLTIDLNPRNPRIESDFFGNRWGNLVESSDYGQFYLTPGNGATQENVITCFVATAGSPTVEANVIWKDTYLSED